MANLKISQNTIFQLIVLLILPLFFISSCKKESKDPAESLDDYISQNKPLITAHRGFAEVAPENTMSAFEAALKAGADASEFDVHMTADGTLVVFHDDTIGRTTNGSGVLKELNYEYLSTLDAGSWKDPKFAGEKIPTLHQTLTFFQNNNMVAVLEIKVADIVDEVLAMLYETKMDKRTVIISFEESAISKIVSEKPEIPALLLLYGEGYMTGSTQNKVNNISQKAEEIGTKYVGPFSFQLEKLAPALWADAIHNLTNNIDPGELPLALDAETVAALHEKGYLIDAWTVDSEANIRDLVTSEVDFLTTNYLERAIRIKKEVQGK
jgi:glycerophosphoryl diester phosphodiesterase